MTNGEQLRPGWKRIDLKVCQVEPSQGDKKVLKIYVPKQNSSRPGLEEKRFTAGSVCSRNVWIKKLLQAKNLSFEPNDCEEVTVQELMALQSELELQGQDQTRMEDQRLLRGLGGAEASAYIEFDGDQTRDLLSGLGGAAAASFAPTEMDEVVDNDPQKRRTKASPQNRLLKQVAQETGETASRDTATFNGNDEAQKARILMQLEQMQRQISSGAPINNFSEQLEELIALSESFNQTQSNN